MAHNEDRIYPPTVHSYNWPSGDPRHGKVGREVPYELYQQCMATKHVGDTLVHHVSAPGCGYIKYRITRMDATGVYAVVVEDTVHELTEGDMR